MLQGSAGKPRRAAKGGFCWAVGDKSHMLGSCQEGEALPNLGDAITTLKNFTSGKPEDSQKQKTKQTTAKMKMSNNKNLKLKTSSIE